MEKTHRASTSRLLVLVFAVLAVMLALIFGAFNVVVNNGVTNKISTTLDQNARQQATYVETILDGQFRTLESAATYLGSSLENDRGTFMSLGIAMVQREDFARLLIADTTGTCITSDGTSTSITNQEYYHNALAGERTVSEPTASSSQAGYVYVMLMVPIFDGQGNVVGTLGGSYASEHFESLFLRNGAETVDSALLIDEDGTVIFTTVANEGFTLGGNIFEEGSIDFLDENSLGVVQEAARQGEVLTTLVKNSLGEEVYTTQAPFGYNGWTLFTSVSRSKIDEKYEFVKQDSARVNAAVSVTFAAAIICILLIVRRDRTRLREDNERIQREKMALMISEERYRLLARDSNVTVFEVNTVDKTLHLSDNFGDQFGTKASYEGFFEGKNLHPDDKQVLEQLLGKLHSGTSHVKGQLRYRNGSGGYRWYAMVLSPVADEDGTMVRILGKLTDIDETMRAIELLQIKAQTDSMTGLYDKEATETLIQKALLGEANTGGTVQALAVIDIDDLKTINDTLGHPQRDRAIKAIAAALKNSFRSTDIVGRIGGDEFMAHILGVESEDQVESIIAALMTRLSRLYAGPHGELPLRCSVGAAVAQPGDTFEALYRRADAALYRAKKNGKAQAALWNEQVDGR